MEKFSKLPIHKYSVSVSRQFFGCELKTMCSNISTASPELKTIYIVDLRQEPHLFLDGIPISYRTPRNRHVVGLNSAEQMRMEEEKLSKTIKTGMIIGHIEKVSSGECSKSFGVCENDNEYKLLETPIIQREEGAVASYCVPAKEVKVVYKRFPITDHAPALFEQIEKYLDFLSTVDFKNSHIHLHCKGGKGRTMSFVSIMEKYLSPNMSMDQILTQQYEAFGNLNLVHRPKDNWKNCLALKRYNALKCLDKLKIVGTDSKKSFLNMPEIKKCWDAQYNDNVDWQNC